MDSSCKNLNHLVDKIGKGSDFLGSRTGNALIHQPHGNRKNICQWTFFAKPRHRVLEMAIRVVHDNLFFDTQLAPIIPADMHGAVTKITGPVAFSRGFEHARLKFDQSELNWKLHGLDWNGQCSFKDVSDNTIYQNGVKNYEKMGHEVLRWELKNDHITPILP